MEKDRQRLRKMGTDIKGWNGMGEYEEFGKGVEGGEG